MKKTRKRAIVALTVVFLALPGVSCSLGGQSNLDTAVQTAVAATLQTQKSDQEPQPKVGETIASGDVEVFIPPEMQGKQPTIGIKPLGQALPPIPQDTTAIGNAYDITAEKLAGPVLITLRYDPADLPLGASEENLYIATLIGDRWEIVPDGLVDTQKHTVNATITHLSIYRILQDPKKAAYDAVKSATGDEITSQYFGDLPVAIRIDLNDDRIKPQDVTAVVNAKLSLLTKGATGVISLANLVSKTSGLAIARHDKTTGALSEAMAEAVVTEGGGQAGSYAVMLYDSYQLGKVLGEFVADTTQGNPALLAAKGTAWLLSLEMEYINQNMDKAFDGLWKLNPTSLSRLQVYAVYVDAAPWLPTLGYNAKGVKFYYYNEKQDTWINYYDNMTYWKVKFTPTDKLAQATQAPAATSTRRPTTAVAPKPPTSMPYRSPSATSKPTASIRATSTRRPEATAVPTRTSPAPAGGKIAFASNRDGNYEIYVMNADGSGVKRLTNNAASDEYPSWSPEGNRIIFQSNRDATRPDYEDIYVMNADGSGVKRLTYNVTSSDEDPAWSPDGKHIAFQSHRDSNWEIYLMNTDGSGLKRLTNHSGDDLWPTWSPDGKQISFYSYRDGREGIYVINADGSGEKRLSDTSSHYRFQAWSPDGHRIAYDCWYEGNYDICAMNADGGAVRNLTHHSAEDGFPTWSPDGTRIAFASGRDGNAEIYVMNADGSNQIRLTRTSAHEVAPVWSP